MEGLNFLAFSKTFLNIFSVYPTNLFNIEPADNRNKLHPDYFESAFVINVLPFPGGPYNKIPLGGDLIPSNRSGLFCGIITASYNIYFSSLIPTISEKFALISLAKIPVTSASVSIFCCYCPLYLWVICFGG